MQAKVGSRKTHKAHKAEESLRRPVEGTELSRALRPEQGKNCVERSLRRNQRQRTPAGRAMRGLQGAPCKGAITLGKASGFCDDVW